MHARSRGRIYISLSGVVRDMFYRGDLKVEKVSLTLTVILILTLTLTLTPILTLI